MVKNRKKNKKIKRALVLSGGGSKGAYTVGVLKALLESGRTYDVVAGVSVGALIGAYLSMQKPGEQYKNFNILEDVWTKEIRGNKNIYKPWAPGFLTYIWSLWKSGIYNMRPLRNILERQIEVEKFQSSGVEFEVGVVSLQTGRYYSANLTSDPKNKDDKERIIDWVWASTIFPVLFPPVAIDGEQWVDGGVRDVIPIRDVLKYNVTHVDAIITSPRDGYVDVKNGAFRSTPEIGLRSAFLLADEVYANDLFVEFGKKIELEIFDPKVNPNKDSFEFDPKEIKDLIELGYNDAKLQLSLKDKNNL